RRASAARHSRWPWRRVCAMARCLACSRALLAQQKLGDFFRKFFLLAIEDHISRQLIRRELGRTLRPWHAMFNERSCAAEEISLPRRVVARGPGQCARDVVVVVVSLGPARAMLQQESSERSVATEHRAVESRAADVCTA